MSRDNSSPDNLFEWGRKEAQHDLLYWQDRQQNGTGLIKQIADFVLKQAGAHESWVKKKERPRGHQSAKQTK